VEGGANIFGVFRVKNHDFTPKNYIFLIAEAGANIFGVFRVKNHDFAQKNRIFPILGGVRAWCAPPTGCTSYKHPHHMSSSKSPRNLISTINF
jgi:hypothetical protein